MSNGVNEITKEGIPQTMAGLQDHKLDQPPNQSDASFGAGLSIVEQSCNCIVLITKHIEHQRTFCDDSIDSNKAFAEFAMMVYVNYSYSVILKVYPVYMRPSQLRVILNNPPGVFSGHPAGVR